MAISASGTELTKLLTPISQPSLPKKLFLHCTWCLTARTSMPANDQAADFIFLEHVFHVRSQTPLPLRLVSLGHSSLISAVQVPPMDLRMLPDDLWRECSGDARMRNMARHHHIFQHVFGQSNEKGLVRSLNCLFL